ncbi:uncharacterized protein Eint_010790 [Encephalitozoon intestinalis ATCC 50506]|uniref:RanBD1 domain-containing protein n=1 Tax=Encephalitozoon intestinalis (strain ATCC 50506) TaxID=876142 RepID=E0S5F6_ENCIT|nr:uncharacterized protein Eint_010790 [Encephalitozoon intestinalis ATCC 50506]ADM10941.1 hypothetical protein Eint_010790 [Encephalitozoon intestinalis ATCC 50506]UTX44576.1 E3 SUMO-protein ligase RanBP2 [Encephalitozoon intestinalis]
MSLKGAGDDSRESTHSNHETVYSSDGCDAKDAASSIFKPVNLEGLKSNRTIFEDLGGEKKQAKESEFLKKPVAKAQSAMKSEIPGVVFKATANLHKFAGEWENIGPGSVYVTKNKEKRCFFIRDGVMMSAFDFLVTYDTRPTKKRLGVCIGVREMSEGKCTEQPYCVVFKNEHDANEFVSVMKFKEDGPNP